MDEPIRSIVRAACPGGLTSPEPVTALARPQRPPASPPSQEQGQAAEQSAARLRCPDGAKITAGKIITRETIT